MAKTKDSRRGVFFKKPFGKSERFKSGNKHEHTLEDITCELCGTNFPERERREGNWLSPASFLGYQCIMECCGKVFDLLYKECSQDFTEELLIDFSKGPNSSDYKELRYRLSQVLKAWHQEAKKSWQGVRELRDLFRPNN